MIRSLAPVVLGTLVALGAYTAAAHLPGAQQPALKTIVTVTAHAHRGANTASAAQVKPQSPG